MSSAAVELHASPAAVSQQIAALEAEVGTPLLKRLARGVAPTAAGEVAGRHARLLAEDMASAATEIEATARGTTGRLRISSYPAASAGLLAPGLVRLSSERPGLEVCVEDRDPEAALSGLRDGTIDLALVADMDAVDRVDTAGLDATELGRATLSVMLPIGHRFSAREVIPLVDLVAEPWIQSADAVCVATVARVAIRPSVVPRITTQSKDMNATRGLVAAGLGIALVTDLLGIEPHGVIIRAVHPPPAHPVLVVTPTESRVLPAAKALGDALVASARATLSLAASNP